ncbi:hypothetical protein DFH28DRAFT_828515, partial [Melampsora americana]
PPFFDAPFPDQEEDNVNEDAAILEFVKRHREERFSQARERLRQNWEALENQITAAYLHTQFLTSNWTTESSYLDCISPDCHCGENNHYHRNLDLIDVLGRFSSKPVKFCRCIPEAVQLIYQGYLPATPTHPRTAFTIRLIQLFHRIWETSVSSATGFIEGLSNFLDDRSSTPLEARGSIDHNRRNLTQPFSSTTHVYSRILTI